MPEEALLKTAPHLTSVWRREVVERLLDWFAVNRRDLPWRRTTDAYAIWISESMLQQTQVATVIDYYQRFLTKFPNVHALAAADEQEVLSMWAGLGYYRRARQLHAAARQLVEQHNGIFPQPAEALQALPGVGRYTAGAISSIAFGLPSPIVEANTERLFGRLMMMREPLRQPIAKRLLWAFAQWLLEDWNPPSAADRKRAGPGELNQAAMELGSLVCRPVEPSCDECPLRIHCPTAQSGLQREIPPPKPKRSVTPLHHVALVIQHQGRWLLRVNPPGAWWHGLWDFPRVDVSRLSLREVSSGSGRGRQLLQLDRRRRNQILTVAETQLFTNWPKSKCGSPALKCLGNPLLAMTHAVTRYRIELDCLVAELSHPELPPLENWRWVAPSDLDDLPLTSTAKKMARQL